MTGGSHTIASIVFDEPDMPGEEQFEVFRRAGAPIFDTKPRGPVHQFHARVIDFMVDDVIVSTTSTGALTLRRSVEHADEGSTDWVSMLVCRAGRLYGEVGPAAVGIGAGEVLVLDLRQPFDLRTDGSELRWVSVPRRRLEAVGSGVTTPPVSIWSNSSHECPALVAMVEHVWAQLPQAALSQGPTLAAALVETLAGALAPAPFEATGAAMTAAMKQYLDDHLEESHLGVADLRRAFHCSRSSIYRLFENEGGVYAFIRERRLQRCYEELTDRLDQPCSISFVATRWGFDNPSHFHRLFTGMFGHSPSSVAQRVRNRSDRRHDDTASRTIDRVHGWLRDG
ncbi:MAG TPA: helix-turn-helix domain-containing protein [Ornithinimicrobium sp.]|uniref:helix-turn-helix domain-containing protein n=1 Tax=Ornithinimicrobium sp. TaxID=1977084 RepID=UPI002B46935A|nr:helix-turn-helix domain-containing protein [Ornithinimicrobium sp.]HKJ10929.1 helix-turn-helix domain-containing protein [Ornithinimicrobium sp.]